MSTAKDIVATIGTYQRNGETKYVTRKVGALIDTSKGLRIKLDASFNPAGCKRDEDGGVWLAIFDQRERDDVRGNQDGGQRTQRQTQPEPVADDFEGDGIPF